MLESMKMSTGTMTVLSIDFSFKILQKSVRNRSKIHSNSEQKTAPDKGLQNINFGELLDLKKDSKIHEFRGFFVVEVITSNDPPIRSNKIRFIMAFSCQKKLNMTEKQSQIGRHLHAGGRDA